MTESVSAIINGTPFERELPANELLLDLLRDGLGITSVKQSCEVQVCGACTVLIDGDPVSSCCLLACEIDGKQVETIDGLVGSAFHTRVTHAFMRHAAVQCGFCTAGMVLTIKALANSRTELDREELKQALSGNLCRCTGYQSILDAAFEIISEHRHCEIE